MSTTRFLTRAVAIITVLVMALGSVQPAYAAAPANDNFANAAVIFGTPFSELIDLTEATQEAGEPYPSCGYGYAPISVWYQYTPAANQALLVGAQIYSTYAVVAVFKGTALNALNEVACTNYYGTVAFAAEAGVTYYIQVTPLYDYMLGQVMLTLDVVPPPQVDFYWSPFDPSAYDVLGFGCWYYDPGNMPLTKWEWNLGDGTTADVCNFEHPYAKDGDYTVTFTGTTSDGRSASVTKTVAVRTYDVAITKLSIPQLARVGQTKTINVLLTNKRYAGYVTVTMYKSVVGGLTEFAHLKMYVPARAIRATTFKFTYTFTAADAAIGKVTFKAIATIDAGRDALPADNEAVGTTIVTK